MRNHSTRKLPAPRQPEADGPDVVYDPMTRDFCFYLDGRILGARDNAQDAWIEARRAHFDALEEAAYATADANADMADLAAIGELVEALAARLGTGDLGYAREVLNSGWRTVEADWDAGFYHLTEAAYAVAA